MNLKNTLEQCADAARNKCRCRAYADMGTDPDESTRSVLLGRCFETARELAYELSQREIPYHPIRGYIGINAIQNSHIGGRIADIDAIAYVDGDTGAINPELWDTVGYPTEDELLDQFTHWWIEVDGTETQFDTDQTYHVEVASEARKYYGEPVVHTSPPDEFFLWTAAGYHDDDLFDFSGTPA